MSGFFGCVSRNECVNEVFYGTDYHSHLGTKRAGMAFYTGKKFVRSIHSLENGYFRNKFEDELPKFGESQMGIGVISDSESQPITITSHLGRYAVVTVARIENIEELTEKMLSQRMHFAELSSSEINATELVAMLIGMGNSIKEGIEYVQNNVKGSFFLTGNCLRMEEHKELIENIIADGHYVGGHSDNHLLYAPWEARDSSLVTRDSLIRDLQLNMAELEKFGIGHDKARWFLPPYEYYNSDHVKWLENSGIKVMNLTPGTATAADYTTADMPNYRSSQTLINTLLEFEKNVGLNGAIILIHPGVESGRPDPLYHRLPEIIKTLKKRGYTFGTFSDLK